ncbi:MULTISPECIES: helix-turn-helix transcriptional regulator [Cyanophyceae]|uniref:helix-turn-helix transcriptional regulator n=1 Tax=Cyanophyceae TaxID=3028117 RepID=UPI001686A09D|nr:AraC family transcriptional regulator [Trichocoleus sp. FACHB-69]MBD1930347.1 helix-turn-helix domain-containing protein [Trichocoleus sp. FACHB-69]
MTFNQSIPESSNLQFTPQPEEELQLIKFLMERVTDAVFCVAPDTHLLYVNQSACTMLGYSREELLSLTMDDIDPDFLLKVRSNHWKTIKQQGSFIFESQHRTKDGWSFPVEITVTYEEYHSREYNCIFARALTQRKQVEVTLQKANKAVESRLEERTALEEALRQSKVEFGTFPHLNEVFHFIEANYHQPITLSDVAQAVGYSPAYLTDLVRRQTGQTVYRWIIKRRMAEAHRLLLMTSQSVQQIAEAVGYLDHGHFIRQFRRFNSMTPQAWRKAYLSNLTSG